MSAKPMVLIVASSSIGGVPAITTQSFSSREGLYSRSVLI